MPVSEKKRLQERLRRLLKADEQHVDIAVQFRVYERGEVDGTQVPGELLPQVYGGRYDRRLRRYIGPAEKVVELSCHRGQVPILTHTGAGHVITLGSPGAGKTWTLLYRAIVCALLRPNSNGAVICPIAKRGDNVWDEFVSMVQPLGWIQDIEPSRKRIVLKNGVRIDFKSARSGGRRYGSPLQGYSWDWACIDESQDVDEAAHREIELRGRRSDQYTIFESAVPGTSSFRLRLREVERNPLYRVYRYKLHDNPWVRLSYIAEKKATLTERDYREQIELEDIPPERLVYARFDIVANVVPQPKPGVLVDLTPILTQHWRRSGVRFLVAHDPGVLVNASLILKVFRGPRGERLWWVIDEITTYGDASDIHAQVLLDHFARQHGVGPDQFAVIADPSKWRSNKQFDRSCYYQFEQAGIDIRPAVNGLLPQEHRILMVNNTFADPRTKLPRLFLDCDDTGRAKARKLVEALTSMQRDPSGRAEHEKKDIRSDLSHWPAALGYGLAPWELLIAPVSGTLRQALSEYGDEQTDTNTWA